MKTEVSPFLPGGNPSRKRFRKPFPLGAPWQPPELQPFLESAASVP